MKLLFNLNNTGGSAEVKRILGFTDADIKFENLKPYVIPATDELIELIGQPLYDSLVGIYEATSASESDADFLLRAQTSILLNAYREFAIDTDLGHTPNGRVNRVEDKQKIAFEWQIERSNRKMERKYYKSLDSLIKFMDANVSGWKTSDAYKATHDLFIRTASQIDLYFNIEDSRLLFLKLVPGIRKAEREEILPRITKTRFDELKNALKENQPISDSYLVEKIQEAVVYKALAWAVLRMSAQLFPEGVLQVADASRLTTSARLAADQQVVGNTAVRFEADAKDALIEIENHIKSLSIIPNQTIAPITPNFDINDNFVDC